MDADEALELNRSLIEMASSQKKGQEKLEKLMISYCYNLEIVGVLGLRSAVNFRNSLVLDEMQKNGVGTWIINQESELPTLVDINAQQICQGFNNPLNVRGVNERMVDQTVKNALKLLQERVDESTQSKHMRKRRQNKDDMKRKGKKRGK